MNEKKEIFLIKEKMQKEQNEHSIRMEKLREELWEQKQKIHCLKCKYCITEAWTEDLLCAKPKQNRRYLVHVTDLTEIRTLDLHEKAFSCPLYEEDGKTQRDFCDLPEDVRLYWENRHINYLKLNFIEVTEAAMNFFRGENIRMKKFTENKKEKNND